MEDLSHDALRATAIDCILSVAPDADFSTLQPDRPWREQFEIDSFDFLNVLVAIESRLDVNVPESDYHKLTTLDDLVTYLEAHLSGQESRK